MEPALESVGAPHRSTAVNQRTLFVSAVAVAIGLGAGLIAEFLFRLIGFITNLSFYGRFETSFVSPAGNHLGLLVILIPPAGGALVGLMARYGSEAIRGHGIPEVMERVLLGQSRIAPRLTFLKPVSAAIAIGTGGPFGAEGPIIATGGALGSLVGQLLKTTADERKILLSAGAAAGMAATFGSPAAAVLIAIELLVFEFRSRSLIPITFASFTAGALRTLFRGAAPMFAMHELWEPTIARLALYTLLGAIVGFGSIVATRAVSAAEEGFEMLPIHWMWWPAIGGLAVGVIGYFVPDTLGVGYDNITALLTGTYVGRTAVLLGAFKFVSWAVALGSGTSGGTLAPLFTIGGALGAVLGEGFAALFPRVGLDARIGALVGMAAMFAGASRALLTSVVFAFETTLEPAGLLPLLGGCTAAFFVSSLFMKETIMTEKIARRGVLVPSDYAPDPLSHMLVRDAAAYDVVSFKASSTLNEVRSWIAQGGPESSHHDFPVVNDAGELLGMTTWRELVDPNQPETKSVGELVGKPPAVLFEDNTLREAVDTMVREGARRLPVVAPANPRKLVAILSHSDIMSAHRRRLEEASEAEQSIRWRFTAPWRSHRRQD
jgi:CIC family chloride channel protein